MRLGPSAARAFARRQRDAGRQRRRAGSPGADSALQRARARSPAFWIVAQQRKAWRRQARGTASVPVAAVAATGLAVCADSLAAVEVRGWAIAPIRPARWRLCAEARPQ